MINFEKKKKKKRDRKSWFCGLLLTSDVWRCTLTNETIEGYIKVVLDTMLKI